MSALDSLLEVLELAGLPWAARGHAEEEAYLVLKDLVRDATVQAREQFKEVLKKTGLDQYGIWGAFTTPVGQALPPAALLVPQTDAVITDAMKKAAEGTAPNILGDAVDWVANTLNLLLGDPATKAKIKAEEAKRRKIERIKLRLAAAAAERKRIGGWLGKLIAQFKRNAMYFVLGALAMALYYGRRPGGGR